MTSVQEEVGLGPHMVLVREQVGLHVVLLREQVQLHMVLERGLQEYAWQLQQQQL